MNRGPLIRLVGALIVLVFVLVGYGIWYSMLQQKSSEVGTLTAQIAQSSDATAKIDEAKSELAQLSTQESNINQYFVATNDVVPFLEQIQAIGKFLGATVEVVSVSAVPGTPYGQLDLSLSITGSFDAVMRTIGSIEFSPYDTTITSLTLNTTPVAGETASSTGAVWTAEAQFTVGAQTGNTQGTASAPAQTVAAAMPMNVVASSTVGTSTQSAATSSSPLKAE